MALYFDNGTYSGDARGGEVANGYGKFSFDNGDTYVGTCVENKCRGFGILTSGGTVCYRGEWFDNTMSGYGCFNYEGGAVYVGSFRDGKPSGFGVNFWPNGDKYVGEHKNGVCHGKGTLLNADGTRIEGWFFKNKLNGVCFCYDEYGAVEKRVYNSGKCTSVTKNALSDRRHYDITGVYTNFTMDGAQCYGKVKDRFLNFTLNGHMLKYVNEDEWEIATYDDGVRYGECVSLEGGDTYVRELYVNGDAVGFSVRFCRDKVFCGFTPMQSYHYGFGIEYSGSDDMYFGGFDASRTLRGKASFYSRARGVLCSASFRNGECRNMREISTRGHGIFEGDLSFASAELGDYVTVSNANEYKITSMYMQSGNILRTGFFNYRIARTTGKTEMYNFGESATYVSLDDGSRIYTVGSDIRMEIRADGLCIFECKVGTVKKKITSDGYLFTRTETVEANGTAASSVILEGKWGTCFECRAGSEEVFISKESYAYRGLVGSSNEPEGQGTMYVHGGSITGQWQDALNCRNATYRSDDGTSYSADLVGGKLEFR